MSSSTALQYLPLLADEEAATLQRSEGVGQKIDPLNAVLIRLGFAADSEADDRADWKSQVDASVFYMLSCFAYSAAGGLLLLHPEVCKLFVPNAIAHALMCAVSLFFPRSLSNVTWSSRGA